MWDEVMYAAFPVLYLFSFDFVFTVTVKFDLNLDVSWAWQGTNFWGFVYMTRFAAPYLRNNRG